VLALSFGGDVKLYFAPDERVPPPGAPTGGYATPPTVAPTAWPSGFAGTGGGSGNSRAVTGELSPHAKAALERMGILKS
jgi:hypothetical protein